MSKADDLATTAVGQPLVRQQLAVATDAVGEDATVVTEGLAAALAELPAAQRAEVMRRATERIGRTEAGP